MITRLPRWVEYGSFILALVAGVVNSVGLLGFKHQSISHLSGTATRIGTGLAESSFVEVMHLGMIVICFVIGAGISGLFLRSSSR